MPSVAAGVAELRVPDIDAQHRVFYCLGQSKHVLVLRAFHKKSQRTPRRACQPTCCCASFLLARRRSKELMNELFNACHQAGHSFARTKTRAEDRASAVVDDDTTGIDPGRVVTLLFAALKLT
jgi:hypothetical protein